MAAACRSRAPIFPEILAGHAIEAVNRFGVLASRDKKFIKGRPVVSPLGIEADAGAQFFGADFAAPPLVEDVLIARIDGFDAKNNRAVAGKGAGFQQVGRAALRAG